MSYSTVHKRLRAKRGPARNRLCVDCRQRAASHWSYDGLDPGELVDENGRRYSTHMRHYQARCSPCHAQHDARRRRQPPQPRRKPAPAPDCRLCGHPVVAGQRDQDGRPAHLGCQRKETLPCSD